MQGPAPESTGQATRAPDAVPARGVGGVPLSSFLDGLQPSLEAMVDEELQGMPFRGQDCPWIASYIERFRHSDVEEGFAFIQRWSGVDPRPLSAEAVAALVVARARTGVQAWRRGEDPAPRVPGVDVEVLAATDGGAPRGIPLHELAGLGAGRPLDPGARAALEPSLGGGSLGGVRVHTDPTAGSLARRAGAHAFTVGSNIVFAPGAYDPHSNAGRLLLAHELAHVQQQQTSGPAASTGELEADADAAALGVATARARPVTRASGGLRLQRCGEPDYNMGVTWPGPTLAPGEVHGAREQYLTAIAMLEARAIDLETGGDANGAALTEVLRTLDVMTLALDTLDGAAGDAHPGENLVWFESQLGYNGWVPQGLGVRQRIAESDPAWQAGVRTANRYRILTERRGFSPAEAIGALGLVTVGEFLGATQLAEAAAGREAITGRELTTGERVLRGVVGVIQVASLTAGTGGPRLGGWAGRVRGTQIRYVQMAGTGTRMPVLLLGEGVVPVVATQAETAALTQAGLMNLAMMSSTPGGGTPAPPAGGGSSPSGSTPARVDPGGRGNYHLADDVIDRLPDTDAARLRQLQSRVPATEAELAELVRLRRRAVGADLPTTAGTPEHMLARWREYGSTPGTAGQTFQQWSAGHAGRMRSSVAGPAREGTYRAALREVGTPAPSRQVTSPSGRPRQRDLLIEGGEGTPNHHVEIKGGRYESLSTTERQSGGASRGSSSHSNAEALDIDGEFVRAGDRATWVFENPPSGPLVQRARERGVSVVIRVDDALGRQGMVSRLQRAGMTEAQIRAVRIEVAPLESFVQTVIRTLTGGGG